MNYNAGPEYPRELGATVAKFRRMASNGLKALSVVERHAYGEAVEQAIRAKQRSELARVTSSPRINCASGTLHTTGEAIHKAMQQKQINALYAGIAEVRRKRTPQEWQSLYAEAMDEKRKQQRTGK